MFWILACKTKMNPCRAHTYFEIMYNRYGAVTHWIFIIFSLLTNIPVGSRHTLDHYHFFIVDQHTCWKPSHIRSLSLFSLLTNIPVGSRHTLDLYLLANIPVGSRHTLDLYLFFSLLTNMFVGSLLLPGGSSVVTALIRVPQVFQFRAV